MENVLPVGKIYRLPRKMPGRVAVVVAVASLFAGCGSHSRQADVTPDSCTAPMYYVALGDSTVEGVGASAPSLSYVSRLYASLRARFPGSRLENLGRGGATSDDVVLRQLDRAIELQPGLVTISVGPNDITTGVSVDLYERNLDIIFGKLRGETAALITINLVPDLALTPRFINHPQVDVIGRKTVIFNEALARKAREHDLVLVDLYEASREEVPRRAELIWKDGYHPSDAGYARWAELMWEAIDPRLRNCGATTPSARGGDVHAAGIPRIPADPS